jgi:hypothetical protein
LVAEGLRCLYERGAHLPWFVSRKKEPANSPLILEQAFSEALDLDKRERVGCYEVHLDRKLERMLVMLLRLKDLRQGQTGGHGPSWADPMPGRRARAVGNPMLAAKGPRFATGRAIFRGQIITNRMRVDAT